MNIGFDARMIGHSGIGVYIRSLLEELLPAGQEHSFTLFGPRYELENLGFQNKNAKIVHSEVPIYSVREQLFHPSLGKKFDVFHVPHYNIPLAYRGKMVVTVHDLNHLRMPEMLPNRLAYPYAKFMIRKAYERASRVICVSQATRKDLTDFLGADGKIEVIHESVRPEFMNRHSSGELQNIRIRHRLPEHYILSVGILKPNKNLVTLLRVFRELRKEGGMRHHLVIVGKRFERHPEILVEIHKGEREGTIRHLENVPPQDLPAIYQLADVFAFISLREGFGLPILEAFASGVPVLASNVSSIPEVAGNGALLVDPLDQGQIKRSLLALLTNQELRQELSEKAKQELTRFSWKKAAQETLNVYENCTHS